jgi:hypothetical protein
MPRLAIFSLEEAWPFISRIEVEIATWVCDHLFDDYPPDNHQPGIPPFFTGRRNGFRCDRAPIRRGLEALIGFFG